MGSSVFSLEPRGKEKAEGRILSQHIDVEFDKATGAELAERKQPAATKSEGKSAARSLFSDKSSGKRPRDSE